MAILTASVSAYLEKLNRERHPALRRMEAMASRRGFPIVGPQVGSLLSILVTLARPRTIIELGSGFGYSALWMVLAHPRAKVIGSEWDADNIKKAVSFCRSARCGNRVRLHQINGIDLLKKQRDNSVEFIFNDVDKADYPEVERLAAKKLRKGGLLVTDNVLWSGKVARSGGDPVTTAIKKFNKQLTSSNTWQTAMLPVRDGVAVSLRIR